MVLVGMVRCDLTREQRSRSAYIPIFVRKLPDLYILLLCLSRFADFFNYPEISSLLPRGYTMRGNDKYLEILVPNKHIGETGGA